VNKTVLIVAFCLVVITGCFISDNSKTDSDRSAIITPVEPAENSVPSTSAVSEATILATRAQAFSQEEIRQLQVRLKEVGFDPGPADGVPGARTRAAFGRLQRSCSAWTSISDNSAQPQPGTLDLRFPDARKDITLVQKRLRTAGFDSGPVDGILGAQTKKVFLAVQNICPKVSEFADYLSAPVSFSEKQRSTAVTFGNELNTQQSIRPANSGGAAKQTLTPVAGQTNEEIRILQLRLRDAGFDPGPFDGIMGPKTRSALQQYDASQRGKKTKISLTTREAAVNDY
jgi:peptidoglycan hydrolase-like protein with peptidoglycan-binding domain